jgi:hypothetical protein
MTSKTMCPLNVLGFIFLIETSIFFCCAKNYAVTLCLIIRVGLIWPLSYLLPERYSALFDEQGGGKKLLGAEVINTLWNIDILE